MGIVRTDRDGISASRDSAWTPVAFPGVTPTSFPPFSLVEVTSEVHGDRPQTKAPWRREPALVLWPSEVLQGIEEENLFSLSLSASASPDMILLPSEFWALAGHTVNISPHPHLPSFPLFTVTSQHGTAAPLALQPFLGGPPY